MAVTLNKANLVLKDANGNIGKIEQLSDRDLTKIRTAVSDVALVVNQSDHTPIEATTTNKGVVQLATPADVVSGASDKVVTAEQLHNATTGTNLARTVNGIKPDANGNIAITSVANATNADNATNLGGYPASDYVRSVNGVNADAEGNVNVTRPVVDYSSGIDIAYRHGGSGAFPNVTIPQDGLMVLYAHSENPLAEEAYVELTIKKGDTILISQAAKPPIIEKDYNIFASITLPVIKGQQVECAVLGQSQRICRLFPYVMG